MLEAWSLPGDISSASVLTFLLTGLSHCCSRPEPRTQTQLTLVLQRKSKSKSCYDRRTVGLCLGVKHSSWAHDQICYCQTFAGVLMWNTLSDERADLFIVAACTRQSSHSRDRVARDSRLLSQIRGSSIWRARSPYLYPPEQGGSVIPQLQGSVFVSPTTQGHGLGIRTQLRAGLLS
jgi:hypothetical protein